LSMGVASEERATKGGVAFIFHAPIGFGLSELVGNDLFVEV
jgi:hypothetical protein